MVSYLFLNGLFLVAEGVFAALKVLVPGPPTWWIDATNAVNTVWNNVPGAMKYFLPLGPVIVAGGAYFGLSVAVGLVALIRRVLLAITP